MSSTMQDGLMWRCAACGERNFNHYENCVSCGRARPPPPDGTLSDTPALLLELSAPEPTIADVLAAIARLLLERTQPGAGEGR